MSAAPSSGSRNPYPFIGMNHFTRARTVRPGGAGAACRRVPGPDCPASSGRGAWGTRSRNRRHVSGRLGDRCGPAPPRRRPSRLREGNRDRPPARPPVAENVAGAVGRLKEAVTAAGVVPFHRDPDGSVRGGPQDPVGHAGRASPHFRRPARRSPGLSVVICRGLPACGRSALMSAPVYPYRSDFGRTFAAEVAAGKIARSVQRRARHEAEMETAESRFVPSFLLPEIEGGFAVSGLEDDLQAMKPLIVAPPTIDNAEIVDLGRAAFAMRRRIAERPALPAVNAESMDYMAPELPAGPMSKSAAAACMTGSTRARTGTPSARA